jgi:hypothetical protein
MNLYGHLLAKDCRRLAMPMGIWLLLLGIKTYLLAVDNSMAAVDSALPSPGFGILLGLWSFASTAGFWFLTVFIAAGVVLDDPPKGTTAFWLTRPFSRGQVAAEKLTVLLGLAFIPCVVTAGQLAVYGVEPKAIAVTILSGLLSGALVPLVVAAFAVTAETFGQFAITAFLILFGCGLIGAVGTGVWQIHRMMAEMHQSTVTHLTVGESKQLAWQVIGAGLALGIVVWRYRCRHARFVLGVVTASTLACMLIPLFWPWDFIGAGGNSGGASPPAVEGIHFSLTTGRRLSNGARFEMVGEIRAESQAPNVIVVPRTLSDERLIWATGATTDIGVMMIPQPPPDRIAPEALAQAIAPAVLLNSPPKQPVQFVLPTGGMAERVRLQQEGAVFKARIDAFVIDCRIVGELPLQPDAHATWGNRPVRITEHHLLSTGGESVTLRSGFIATPLALALGAGESQAHAGPIEQLGPVYLLVNRSKNEALILSDLGRTRSTSFGGYTIQSQVLTVEGENVDAEWEKQAVLVCVEYRVVGKATGSIASTQFDLAP